MACVAKMAPGNSNRSVAMKPLAITIAATLAAALSVGPAFASQKLAQERGCIECHKLDVDGPQGPSFKKIAILYRGLPAADVKPKLVHKVRVGGTEHWGTNVMPPQSYKVSDAQAKKLVDWCLTVK
jgi:cytochrome c551/c552